MYFEPEMEVVNLKLQGMLCGSPLSDEGGEATLITDEGSQDQFPNQE